MADHAPGFSPVSAAEYETLAIPIPTEVFACPVVPLESPTTTLICLYASACRTSSAEAGAEGSMAERSMITITAEIMVRPFMIE